MQTTRRSGRLRRIARVSRFLTLSGCFLKSNCTWQTRTAKIVHRKTNRMHSQQCLVSNRKACMSNSTHFHLIVDRFRVWIAVARPPTAKTLTSVFVFQFRLPRRIISLCWRSKSRPDETRADWIYHYRIWSRHVSSAIRLSPHRKLPAYMSDDSWLDLCRRALRLTGAATGVLPSCQAIP